ncbi:ATP-grasp fold amidoligase family protein [Vagococcus acidifermentans]|uniref:Uncharacterized protein n=1 Tax=Vagococcus acidifermentans TaxID=564710 RepID=A0A430AZ76_9ENTE|nr:ATP-grasp fold amidoligase family protein [Vagococcus acidifermentans]RSU13373.1 hypothetical protein CBF27_04125 [Vagococcus acidifermentans]
MRKIKYKIIVLLTHIFPEELLTKIAYRLKMKKKLNLRNPSSFNEKLQWLKINWQRRVISDCADKLLVRDYVIKKNLKHTLIELYAVYKNVDDIDWKNLPEKYVIKTTNSCGTNIIVRDSKSIDIKSTKSLLKTWLSEDYGREHLEFQYSKIDPSIIIEEFIESDLPLPQDYKFFCFNGIPKFILCIDERDLGTGKKKKGFYNLEWEYLDYIDEKKSTVLKNAKRPENLDDMIQAAKILSEDFPFVRVDLYSEKGRVIFGELTFTPMGGMANYFKGDTDLEIGTYLELPQKKYKGYVR